MWDDNASVQDRAATNVVLSSWAIPAVICLGLIAWSGIGALFSM